MIRLQQEAVQIEELLARVRSDGDGAVSFFVGTVRDHNRGRKVLYLEYHAYAEMAEREMHKLREQALRKFDLSEVGIVHRTGRLEIGEVSVAIATAAAHRADAMEACRWLIDNLKQTVPIWKKEHFEGGESWIEGPLRPDRV